MKIVYIITNSIESKQLGLNYSLKRMFRMIRMAIKELMCICRFKINFRIQNVMVFKSVSLEHSNIQEVYTFTIDFSFDFNRTISTIKKSQKVI